MVPHGFGDRLFDFFWRYLLPPLLQLVVPELTQQSIQYCWSLQRSTRCCWVERLVFMEERQSGFLLAEFPAAIAICCRMPARGLPAARQCAAAPQAPGLAQSIEAQDDHQNHKREVLHVVQVGASPAYGPASRGSYLESQT